MERERERPRRGHRVRGATIAVIVVGAALLLVGWNRAASSPGLCSSCHGMQEAAFAASRSVHADVPCLGCHTRPGVLGSLRYVPTLAREGLAEATGWDVASGVLAPAACESCHEGVHPEVTPERPDAGTATGSETTSADCTSCHGDVSHPGRPVEPDRPHPATYIETHGADVTGRPGSCASCHETEFCQACHFKTSFPHPDGWIERHGGAQQTRGSQACTLCHPTTFCAGCHGTDIPHRPTWLGEHWRQLQDQSDAACAVCHPPADCESCHARHDVHREQDLYG